MTNVRQPCVAGFFYPADPNILQNTVQELINKAAPTAIEPPRAIIAPHAGYVYSGPIAATIYKTLLPWREKIKRVILFGPAHRVPFLGVAATGMDYFATPLGKIAIDHAAINQALTIPGVKIFEHAYDMEHSLEVQLPFLQTVLVDFKLAPFVVGDIDPQIVAQIIKQLWQDESTLFVISSDLSHYYAYDEANNLDLAASNAIINLQPQAIHDNQACGRLPVKGLLLAAKELGLKGTVLDLRNSGDTAGDKQRVVGYGAYHFI